MPASPPFPATSTSLASFWIALAPGSSIFTGSYSQTVVDSLRRAATAGKLSRVVIAESVDPSGHVYEWRGTIE
jgi:translation initiation factor 2B subunit (eIF-2B alpha/beta/delta family)